MTDLEEMAHEYKRALDLDDDKAATEILGLLMEEVRKLHQQPEYASIYDIGEELVEAARRVDIGAIFVSVHRLAKAAARIDMSRQDEALHQSGLSIGWDYVGQAGSLLLK